jgi:5-methylcytosine-specific restriction endonuclease McrA
MDHKIKKYNKKPKQTKKQRDALYQECIRDMPHCMMCGSHYWNQIHHILYSPIRITEKGKLIVLCKNCHDIAHSNEKKHRPILLEIVRKFYKEEV